MTTNRETTNWEIEKRIQDKKQREVVGMDAVVQGGGVRAAVVTVTPEKAAAWLQRGGKNRKISPSHVRMLVREMVADRWCLNGETITFSDLGQLLDGQHRLQAVVQSGRTIQSLVTFGIPDPRAWETIDTNQRKRTAVAILDADGYKHTKYLAAAARRLIHWDATDNKANFNFSSESWRHLSQANLLEYARAHDPEIQEMLIQINNCLPFKNCKAGAALLSVLVILNRTDERTTYLFIDGLRTGANLPEHSSVTLLRDRLIAPPERRGMDWELELMALTVKAWNYFSIGKTVRGFQWRQSGPAAEKFPIPRGYRN